jgi:DNA-binding GntR family transcriptional regulator
MEKARDPVMRVRLYADFHEAILAPARRPYLVATIRGIILSGLRYLPVWLEAWAASGVTITPSFAPVLDALEKNDVAGALGHLQRVWGEQEGMLADFLERRETGAASKPASARKALSQEEGHSLFAVRR